MSGGSFDHLYAAAPLGTLGSHRETLEAMAARLEEIASTGRPPGAYRALVDTRMILDHFACADRHAEALADVWRAVEWHASGDSGIEHVREALTAYEETWGRRGTAEGR